MLLSLNRSNEHNNHQHIYLAIRRLPLLSWSRRIRFLQNLIVMRNHFY